MLLARELGCVLFCLSGALCGAPSLFRIDGGTNVVMDSDFAPSAKVERIALPQLGCAQMARMVDRAEQSSVPTQPADTRKRKRAEAEDVVAEHCMEGVWSLVHTGKTYPQLPKLDTCEWCANDFTINCRNQKPLRYSVEGRVVCSPCATYRYKHGGMRGLACCIESKLLSVVCMRKGLNRLPPDAKKYELKTIVRKGEPVKGKDALYAKLHDLDL